MGKDAIVEVFGKFAVELEGEVVMFDDRSAAETAVIMAENAEEIEARAGAYCEARGLVDKNAAAKTRIISDFLAFEATLVDTPEDEDLKCDPA